MQLPSNITTALHTVFQVMQYGGIGIGVVMIAFTLATGARKDVQKRREAWDNVIGIAAICLALGTLSAVINWIFTAMGIGSYLPKGVI
ncbi:MAG TPA: hypothetical protein DCZ00_03200 [Lactococcus sp.]|uniref:hypothetical protein n=1 Tax=unclassified Lactococcus TaxID=2643510 RepID=UPI000E9DF8C1|nr:MULTISPECIES: hypothetical protein [unclassified Lactococcus]HBC90434.1 hypothetical protein [Lactococcus sp.]